MNWKEFKISASWATAEPPHWFTLWLKQAGMPVTTKRINVEYSDAQLEELYARWERSSGFLAEAKGPFLEEIKKLRDDRKP